MDPELAGWSSPAPAEGTGAELAAATGCGAGSVSQPESTSEVRSRVASMRSRGGESMRSRGGESTRWPVGDSGGAADSAPRRRLRRRLRLGP